MLNIKYIAFCLFLAHLALTANAGEAVAELVNQYRSEGAGVFLSENGRLFWSQGFQHRDGKMRRCNTCHGDDPRLSGRHIVTGKTIKPLAPSVNPASLSDPGKINKWLKRNCKWTLGRECTPQEKGDVVTWLNSL